MQRASHFRNLFLALGLLAMGGLLGACTETTPCSANEEFRNGYCYPVDAGVCVGIDAGSTTFGQGCSQNSECVSPTFYCAIQPPNTCGFCTAFGCDTDPSLCPSDWTCMDLTPRGLAAHLCTPN
jgi:hypothetical protein